MAIECKGRAFDFIERLLHHIRSLSLYFLKLAPGCCRCQETEGGEVKVSSVLGFVEVKNVIPGQNAIRQTMAYSLCPLAYSRWGRWRNKEPLVSLLISPQCLLRLTFTKSSDSAFGIELNIASTNNETQIEYELYKYVMKYIEDYHKAATADFIDHDSVNPLDWTPMTLMSKNGFLFRTSSDAVKNLQEKYAVSKRLLISLQGFQFL